MKTKGEETQKQQMEVECKEDTNKRGAEATDSVAREQEPEGEAVWWRDKQPGRKVGPARCGDLLSCPEPNVSVHLIWLQEKHMKRARGTRSCPAVGAWLSATADGE